MRKLLALSGLGSSVAFWLMTSTVAPKLVLILVIFVMDALQPSLGAGDVTFLTSTGALANTILNFARDFFTAGGITNTELVVGL